MLPKFIFFLIKIIFLQLYPAYASYKAIKLNDTERLATLLMYWVVVSALTAIEGVTDIFVFWVPFYNDIKALFVIWLVLPQTQGSVYIYHNYVLPYLLKNEAKIDRWLTDAQNNASNASINLGKRSLKAIQTVALESFLKNQSNTTEPQTPASYFNTFQSVLVSALASASASAADADADTTTSFAASSVTVSSPASAAAGTVGYSWLSAFSPNTFLPNDSAESDQPIIHPSSLGDAAAENLTSEEILAKRARLEAALRQLDDAAKKRAGGVVVVEGYGKEERVEEFNSEDDQEPTKVKGGEKKKMA